MNFAKIVSKILLRCSKILDISCFIVLTNSGANTENLHIKKTHGDVKYFCVENIGRNGIADDAKAKMFLRVIGEMIQMVELVDRPVHNPSVMKWIHKQTAGIVSLLQTPTTMILILVAIIATLVAIILSKL